MDIFEQCASSTLQTLVQGGFRSTGLSSPQVIFVLQLLPEEHQSLFLSGECSPEEANEIIDLLKSLNTEL